VLQCVAAVCCSVLPWVAVCCRVSQFVAVCCRVSQCVAVCRSVLQCVAVYGSVVQCVAVCCRVLQCVAVHGRVCFKDHTWLLRIVWLRVCYMRVFLYQTKKKTSRLRTFGSRLIFRFSKISSIVKSHCQCSSKLTFENVFVFRRIVWCKGCKRDGRLQWVGSLKLDVSFAEFGLFSRALFEKRHTFLGLQERRSVPKRRWWLRTICTRISYSNSDAQP